MATGASALILTTSEPRSLGAARVVRVESENGRPAVSAVLKGLTAAGVGSLLIEGGATDEHLNDFLGLQASVTAKRLREAYMQSSYRNRHDTSTSTEEA